jgi:hypothetical protein
MVTYGTKMIAGSNDSHRACKVKTTTYSLLQRDHTPLTIDIASIKL